MKGAYKVYSDNDFIDFINKVGKNETICEKERKEINSIINQHHDDRSTERTVDFITNVLES